MDLLEIVFGTTAVARWDVAGSLPFVMRRLELPNVPILFLHLIDHALLRSPLKPQLISEYVGPLLRNFTRLREHYERGDIAQQIITRCQVMLLALFIRSKLINTQFLPTQTSTALGTPDIPLSPELFPLTKGFVDDILATSELNFDQIRIILSFLARASAKHELLHHYFNSILQEATTIKDPSPLLSHLDAMCRWFGDGQSRRLQAFAEQYGTQFLSCCSMSSEAARMFVIDIACILLQVSEPARYDLRKKLSVNDKATTVCI